MAEAKRRTYAVRDKEGGNLRELVKAQTPAQVARYLIETTVNIGVATQDEIEEYCGNGNKVSVAGSQDEGA